MPKRSWILCKTVLWHSHNRWGNKKGQAVCSDRIKRREASCLNSDWKMTFKNLFIFIEETDMVMEVGEGRERLTK